MKRSAFLRLALAGPWAIQRAFACEGYGYFTPAARAVDWLMAKQSVDGAWRSDTYGAFCDGRALTPIVLRALARQPFASDACDKACEWLLANSATLFDEYPVHLASAVMESAAYLPALHPLTGVAQRRLFELQCPRTGGWSYSPLPIAAGGPLSPMEQANLAATTMAVDGLRAAGFSPSDSRLQRALPFVHACQNFGNGPLDDGGFFQLPDDPARNKAGVAGIDSNGNVRYHSYASATADGLRALLHCGESPDSPRVRKAKAWLERFSSRSPADLKYYTARSLKKCGLPVAGLMLDQRPDGSWQNPAGEMREDCPIVATALALEAL
jgi:hypothetical protein